MTLPTPSAIQKFYHPLFGGTCGGVARFAALVRRDDFLPLSHQPSLSCSSLRLPSLYPGIRRPVLKKAKITAYSATGIYASFSMNLLLMLEEARPLSSDLSR